MSNGSTATIESQLDRPTLLIGNQQALLDKFPAASAQLAACRQLTICGELGEADPAAEMAERITNARAERLWIIGGDGTINLAAECALRYGLRMPCWLTPAGTANDLARSLTDVIERRNTSDTQSSMAATHQSIDPVLQGCQAIDLDVIRVELDDQATTKACANMLTLGTSARNTQHVTSEIKARWGALAYLTQAWRAIGDLEPFSLKLQVGESQTIVASDILNVFVANGTYCGGGHKVAPAAELDDGLLNVIILRRGTTGELAHLAAAFLAGTHLDHELIEHFTTDKIAIEFEDESPLTLDGEATLARRIALAVSPRHLSVQLLAT